MDNNYLEIINQITNNPFHITNVENPDIGMIKISLKKSNGKTYTSLKGRTEEIMEYMAENYAVEYGNALKNREFMEEEYRRFPKAILHKLSPSKKEIKYVVNLYPEIIEEFDNIHYGKLFCDSFDENEKLPEESIKKIREHKLYRNYGGFIKFFNKKERMKHLFQALKTEPKVITLDYDELLPKRALKMAFRNNPELILKMNFEKMKDYYVIIAINRNPDLILKLYEKMKFSINLRWFILCNHLVNFIFLPDINELEIRYIVSRIPHAIAFLKNKLTESEQTIFIIENPEFAKYMINDISSGEQIKILKKNPFLYKLINKPKYEVNQFINKINISLKNNTWTEYFKSFVY